jgi:hypothetical protein
MAAGLRRRRRHPCQVSYLSITCCQARLPSRTHLPLIRIWHSHLLLMSPARRRPSTTAMPNYPEIYVKKFIRYSTAAKLQCKPRLPSRRSGVARCAAPHQVGVSSPAAFRVGPPPPAHAQYEPFSKPGCVPTRMVRIRATRQEKAEFTSNTSFICFMMPSFV